MKFRSYNAEIRTATAQVLDVFNNIIIDRRDRTGVQQLIEVPCVYGNRSRILKSMENKNKTLKPPLIAITKGGLSRDTVRIADTNNGLIYQNEISMGYDVNKNRPQPMNIEFEMSIVTRYEDDMDQIISNFIPMMTPDFYVVWPNPKQPGKHLKSQVVWDGSINYEYPTDVGETDPYRIIVTTSFTYKTWIFPGMGEDADDGPAIHKINFCPNLLSIGDDNYGLDRWYDVPMNMSIDQYQNQVVCGLIKIDQTRENWDWLPISAGLTAGYADISAILDACCPTTGLVTGYTVNELLDGELENLTYLFTDEGNLLVLSDYEHCIENYKERGPVCT